MTLNYMEEIPSFFNRTRNHDLPQAACLDVLSVSDRRLMEATVKT